MPPSQHRDKAEHGTDEQELTDLNATIEEQQGAWDVVRWQADISERSCESEPVE